MKKNVKNRNPADYEELKKFCIEEWNNINPRNYFKNFLRRVKMVISINGNRLEPYHLEKIREEEKKEEKKEEENEKKEEKNDIIRNRKLKRVFNEVFLDNLKKSEIRRLKKEKTKI